MEFEICMSLPPFFIAIFSSVHAVETWYFGLWLLETFTGHQQIDTALKYLNGHWRGWGAPDASEGGWYRPAEGSVTWCNDRNSTGLNLFNTKDFITTSQILLIICLQQAGQATMLFSKMNFSWTSTCEYQSIQSLSHQDSRYVCRLQSLSFLLCHNYAVATRVVSIPTPVYCIFYCSSLGCQADYSVCRYLCAYQLIQIPHDTDLFIVCMLLHEVPYACRGRLLWYDFQSWGTRSRDVAEEF